MRCFNRRLPCGLLACGLTLAALLAPPARAMAAPGTGYDVKVLVITAFDPEAKPWVERKRITRTFPIAGIANPVRCTDDGVCILTAKMGKANAAVSVSALLADPPFDLSRTIFLTAGLAGGPPQVGTIGSVAWAHYILDFDLFHHLVLDREGSNHDPLVERQVEPVGSELFTLNKPLVDLAYAVTKETKLSDSERAKAYRAHYPDQAGRVPGVLQCDTVAGDLYWHGRRLSAFVSELMKRQTKGAGTYCTTEMEDSATADALARFGYLDRYLNLRVIGNLDQPYSGQPVRDSLRQIYRPVATENLFRVGDAFVTYVLAHREEVLAKTQIR
ncbi:MAG TPA: purine nucleoside permease [Symbiobacteriaceae bacterium]|nr:purine nucleoside permease [Symbiobacteriaceae bacterium]